jgi:hypothetical protein
METAEHFAHVTCQPSPQYKISHKNWRKHLPFWLNMSNITGRRLRPWQQMCLSNCSSLSIYKDSPMNIATLITHTKCLPRKQSFTHTDSPPTVGTGYTETSLLWLMLSAYPSKFTRDTQHHELQIKTGSTCLVKWIHKILRTLCDS